jgi:cytochrome bd-type quinol oxidase subunit 1
MVSAFFILTANAWMQHPVGYCIVYRSGPMPGAGVVR